MTDNGNARKQIIDKWRRRVAKADEERPPEFLSSRMGTRKVSFSALLERIVANFNDEHQQDSPALLEASTETKRLKLLLSTVDYVLSVESVSLSEKEKATVMRRAYAEIFGYGPIDALFADESVTTILIEGADKVSVRRGHGELETIPAIFEDESHLRHIIARLLRDAGAVFDPNQPIMEVGLTVDDRPVAVNLALPPVTLQIHADIRVHPKVMPVLDDLVRAGTLSAQAVILLSAIARSPHGFMIVGDTEAGKTTLMSILSSSASTDGMIAVERAGELRLPEGVERLTVVWQSEDGKSFTEQVQEALAQSPKSIVLDEVRADETHGIAPLLNSDESVRQMWIFRGPSDTKRLTAALGMVARRADSSRGEALLHALYDRLPFVIGVRRFKEQLQLRSIAEWQRTGKSDYPDFVELMAPDWEGIALTERRSLRSLDLPDDFYAE